MSVKFSGWEVVDDGASFPGVELKSSQKPKNRGIYIMYHGTRVASARLILANGFTPSSGGTLGQGVYVSRDKNKATNYPYGCSPSDHVIFELRVRVGRVKRIDANSLHMQHTWHANGYDTAWIPPSPGRLEEDCVFDPKRVEVVGIAKAPNATIEKELLQLIAKKSKKRHDGGGGGGGGGSAAIKSCSVCKRKTQEGSQHITQQCWECGKTICILMSKHFCSA